jgi:hypothetical protein
MACWFGVIVLWELFTIPAMSHSNSWQGVWLSIALLPFSSYRMSRSGLCTSWFFVYGFAGSVLFLPRFFGMDRFRLWIASQAPSEYILLAWWLCIATGLGALCWGGAQLRRACDERNQQNRRLATALPKESTSSPQSTDRLASERSAEQPGLKHLMLWIFCIGVYLGVIRIFSTARQFLAYPANWRVSLVTGVSAVGAGAGLLGVLLFVGRRNYASVFPTHAGEFLLVALGVRSLFRLIAEGVLVVVSSPETIIPSFDSIRALTAAGSLVTALILIAALHGSNYPWRIFFACMAATGVMSCFEAAFFQTSFQRWYQVFQYVPSVVLLGAVARDLSQGLHFPWTHWFGVATQLWFSVSRLLWLVLSLA